MSSAREDRPREKEGKSFGAANRAAEGSPSSYFIMPRRNTWKGSKFATKFTAKQFFPLSQTTWPATDEAGVGLSKRGAVQARNRGAETGLQLG